MNNFRFCVILYSLLAIQNCNAELSGNRNSINSDAIFMQASYKEISYQNYSVFVLTCQNGTIVKEFYNPQEGVFAISWNGPLRPNLKLLFGNYFAEYQNSISNINQPRTEIITQTKNIKYSHSGRPGNFHGYIYLLNAQIIGFSENALL